MNSSDEIYQDKEDLDHNHDEVVQNHMKSQIAKKIAWTYERKIHNSDTPVHVEIWIPSRANQIGNLESKRWIFSEMDVVRKDHGVQNTHQMGGKSKNNNTKMFGERQNLVQRNRHVQ